MNVNSNFEIPNSNKKSRIFDSGFLILSQSLGIWNLNIEIFTFPEIFYQV